MTASGTVFILLQYEHKMEADFLYIFDIACNLFMKYIILETGAGI